MSDIEKAASAIRSALPGFHAKTAFILGSGLGGAVTGLLDEQASISYANLPGFPRPTVSGHEGRLVLGTINNVPVIFLKGREHLYENPDLPGLKSMIQTLKALGVETLFITNSAGSLRREFNRRSLPALAFKIVSPLLRLTGFFNNKSLKERVEKFLEKTTLSEFGVSGLSAITDHINFTGTNPLEGPRFLSQGNAWDKRLLSRLFAAAQAAEVSLRRGVYAQFRGPVFETPAEIRMVGKWGATLVGMSTVMDNIIGRDSGLKCVGVSIVINPGEGLSDIKLSHEQTEAAAALAVPALTRLIRAFVTQPEAIPAPPG